MPATARTPHEFLQDLPSCCLTRHFGESSEEVHVVGGGATITSSEQTMICTRWQW